MIKVYTIQVKNSDKSPDILWWDGDVKINGRIKSCLAFFYNKKDAQDYLNWIKSEQKENLNYEVISFSPNSQH
jgi:hypothetical protein